MADISDVLTGIGQLVGDTLYPAGAAGEALSPVVNAPVLIQAGWPDSGTLQTELPAGKAFVSIFPAPHERSTTRYPEIRAENPIPPATWSLTKANQNITVGGGNSDPYSAQNLAVFIDGKVYVYQAKDNETPDLVAQALNALIAADIAGTSVVGATITVPDPHRIGPLRVGVFGTTSKEVGRVERQVSIIIWTGVPALRDALAKTIDPVLRANRRVTVADGETARLTYVRSLVIDAEEKEGIYRRDLVFAVEYGVTLTESWPQIVADQMEVKPTADSLAVDVGVTEYPSAAVQFTEALDFDISPTTSSSG